MAASSPTAINRSESTSKSEYIPRARTPSTPIGIVEMLGDEDQQQVHSRSQSAPSARVIGAMSWLGQLMARCVATRGRSWCDWRECRTGSAIIHIVRHFRDGANK